jgi:hypothetical protein
MKKLLIIVAILAVAGGAIGYYLWNKPTAGAEKKKPDFVMTPSQLLADFVEDEVSANAKYLGKVIQISGMIDEIKPDAGLRMQVVLDTGIPMSSISCVMQEHHDVFLKRNLKKGDTVTIKGFCSGAQADALGAEVILDRCAIVAD